MHRDQGRNAAAFGKDFAHPMTGGLRGHHADVDFLRRDDRAVANIEAMGEHQRLPLAHVRSDVFVVDGCLGGIGGQNHDDVGPLGGIGDGEYFQAGGLGLLDGPAGCRQADADIDA